MRILVLNYEYPPIGGGGGFVTRDIFEHVALKGHAVTVITSHYEGLAKQEMVKGVNIIRVPVFSRKKMEVANILSMLTYFPSSVLSSLQKFKIGQFDIINTHFAVPSGPAGYCVSKIFDLPNVLSIHGGDIFDPSKPLSPHRTPLLSHTVNIMLNTADRVVAQSSDTRNNTYSYYKVNRLIDVIPLGINKPVFKKKTRTEFDINSNDFVFCTIGRLIKRKNLDDILKILSEIKSSHKFKLIIIGDGPEYYHLVQLSNSLNLEGKVIMTGNVSDEEKFQLIDLSDCYMSTATHEGFGLVFLEAMESGLPIICYNRGGQNDFLINGKTGFLVEVGDRKKIGEKALQLMNDSQLCSRISTYNKELVQSYYISKCSEKYLFLFTKTISEYRKKKIDHK